jgi:carboxypeptidase PM20D1
LRFLAVLLALIAALAAALAVNTYRKGSRQIAVQPAPAIGVDAKAAAEHLAGAIRFATVSYDDGKTSTDELRKLQRYLEQTYPRAHAALKREVVGNLSLLYTWPGSDSAAAPILLMAHQDVVPIAPGTEKDWQAEPFAGTIRDGFVWGRGAWDDKGNLVAILEAVERLAREGFRPRRTIYLAFGHDEEAGGENGARKIAELLASRGVKLELVLDEGLLITDGVLAGLDKPAALIGIAEKGFLNLSLSSAAAGGHSSMPAPRSAIGTLSSALARLERDPMPATIHGVAAQTLETLAPEMHGPSRVVLSNLWLFAPLVVRQFEKGGATNAMLRTTTALTIFQAGNKVNVIPGRAEAVVNFRLLPGDTAQSVLAHARSAIGDGAVKIEAGTYNEASAISPTDTPSYRLLARTIREVFPGTLVAPGLMLGATDSRHMAALSSQIFRFSPVLARPEDLGRFHGTNERLSVDNFAAMIAFYHRLIRNSGSEP